MITMQLWPRVFGASEPWFLLLMEEFSLQFIGSLSDIPLFTGFLYIQTVVVWDFFHQ